MLDGRRVWLALALLAACGKGRLTPASPDLSLTPSPVVFQGWVGFTRTVTVEVRNRGTANEQGEVTLTGPFSTDVSSLEAPAGGVARLVISYHPREAGHHSGELIVGSVSAALEGDAQQPPECVSSLCSTSAFDADAGTCVVSDRTDGTACETVCVKGSCQAGECRGAFNGCDDGDACTVDSCDETSGCLHAAQQCAVPRNPCEAAFCDHQAGCGISLVTDGTPCGPDPCNSATAHICLGGRCEERTRTVAACTDGWSHPFMLSQYAALTTYDSDRQRVVMFSSKEGSTWEWDGTQWLDRAPAHSPGTAVCAALTYDSVRKVSVFFDGWSPDGTWEWNGNDWTQVPTPHSPGLRCAPAAAFSPIRNLVTLFGGSANGSNLGDTWEYDGTDWTLRIPQRSAGVQGSGGVMVYHPVTEQEVLFLNGTVQWDGSTWSGGAFLSAPYALLDPTIMYFDPARQNVVMLSDGLWELTGGKWNQRSSGWPPVGVMSAAHDDATGKLVALTQGPSATWEFDGTSWSMVVPSPEPSLDLSALVTAGSRALMVGYDHDVDPTGALQIFEWTSGAWQPVQATNSPTTSVLQQVAYDSSRQALVALLNDGSFYSYDVVNTLWEWDGASWSQRTPQHSPLPRGGATALAYDPVRRVTVLFGGWYDTGTLSDTWEWNGIDWTQLHPQVSPPPLIDAAMGYDEVNHCMVLFGGHDQSGSSETWIFDGAEWARAWTTYSPASRDRASLVFDPNRGRLRLLGGSGLYPWDAWEWTGSNWLPLANPPTAAAIYGEFHFAYDPAQGQFVGYAGKMYGGVPDTWLYTPP
ncbi:MAG: hypothetical protein QM723_01320 [Myxococcaceae bacterium]